MTDEILGDRYLIQQQLGKKTGRRTLLARDLQTEDLVVIKLLLFTSDFEWDDLKLFEREAQILQTLSHPAIPRYLNYFELADTYGKGFALVQTYIEAPSLESQLKAGRTFTEVEVKQLATALLDILVYLHGQQPPVIHRDIKPSNILLTNRSGNSVGQVYLVDFGSVQTLAAKEGGTITVVGTYGYMPQEQFGGRTVPASDLYGLGATLIYVVTGVHPAELPQQRMRIDFRSRAHVSPEFADWLEEMLEPDVSDRCQSAQEAIQLLKTPRLSNNPLLPESTKATIYRFTLSQTDQRLVIKIPPAGLAIFRSWHNVKLLLAVTAFFSLPVLAEIFSQIVQRGSGIENLLIILFSPLSPLTASLLGYCLYLMTHTEQVQIDKDSFRIQRRLLGFQVHDVRGLTIEINKVEIHVLEMPHKNSSTVFSVSCAILENGLPHRFGIWLTLEEQRVLVVELKAFLRKLHSV